LDAKRKARIARRYKKGIWKPSDASKVEPLPDKLGELGRKKGEQFGEVRLKKKMQNLQTL
jgi:hypothetical protein